MTENIYTNKISEKGIICAYPFSGMYFFIDGNVYNCCPPWPKYKIGNIKNNTIAEIWNSNTTRWIRRKMYEGEWQEICNPSCPAIFEHLHSNKLIKYEELEDLNFLSPEIIKGIREKKDYLSPPPSYLVPNVSTICNLACIMCPDRQYNEDQDVLNKLWPDLKNYLPTAKYVLLSGFGDPLARPDTRELLMTYENTAAFHLLTNGLLLPRYWEHIKHKKFASINISVDAGTQQTYEKIRRGGKWEDLLKALDLIKQNRDKFETAMINMTVMRSNYREIPQFIDLAESYGLNCSLHPMYGPGQWENENIFELNDTGALTELGSIFINEGTKKRNIVIDWGDGLPYYLNLKK